MGVCKNSFISIVILSLLGHSFCKESSQSSNICSSQKTCGGCVGKSVECYWCKASDYSSEERCGNLLTLQQNNCSEIVAPKSKLVMVKDDKPRDAASLGDDPVQLSPQEIRVKLRANEYFEFPVKFRQAENYPVDLYFIMDVSFTMKAYMTTLGNLSHVLAEEIRNITKDFRIGFGAFVDKPILPYVAIVAGTGQIEKPCDTCILPYGFRNQLSLTTNDTEFKERIRALESSGNLDGPEGGFDAIMQAVVCKKEIGWRNRSRKMLLFSTDGSFHYAGDGKLAGIVIPNDGLCHIDKEGYYTESQNQDYPSITQLSRKITEEKMNLIFAVHESQLGLYNRLSSFILGSNVGKLEADSSNVIDIVKTNYDRIRSAIELQTENLGDVDISFKVKCPGGIMQNGSNCSQIGIGQEVSFIVTIHVDSCPSDRSQWNKTFQIYPVGLTEKLTVNLELICECPCELPGVGEVKSAKCNSSGTYECGICNCNQGFYGKMCECGGVTSGDADENDMSCLQTNTSEVCEGKGHCQCGQCVCNSISQSESEKRYSGEFCQCNDYSCDYYQGQICGGPKRGRCDCGTCKCLENHKGSRCECPVKDDLCMAKNKKMCNGEGRCVCGACECFSNSSFKGPTCEDCPTCAGKCEPNRFCVMCFFKDKKDFCHSNCSDIKIDDKYNDFENNEEWRKCSIRDENSCGVKFVYSYKTNALNVQKTKVCPYQPDSLVIILSVIGGVILIGVISLLVWKVVVTIHDKHEYEAFVEEQTKARWEVAENPIFKKATTNFQNPTYRAGNH